MSGGASGLGAATVRVLARAGARCTILDRNEEAAARLAGELGPPCRYVAGDVTDEAQVRSALDVATEAGPLRIAVNCAGVAIAARVVARDGSPHDLAAFSAVVGVNLVGTFNVLRLAAAAMVRSAEPSQDGERGVVVNTASVAAFEGQIGQAAYAASKGGIVGLTLPAARDLSSVGIRVVTIAPGIMDTPLLGMLGEDARKALAAGVPFPKRLGTPEDYAQLVEHVCRNGYLNGEVIRLDGALRMPPR